MAAELPLCEPQSADPRRRLRAKVGSSTSAPDFASRPFSFFPKDARLFLPCRPSHRRTQMISRHLNAVRKIHSTAIATQNRALLGHHPRPWMPSAFCRRYVAKARARQLHSSQRCGICLIKISLSHSLRQHLYTPLACAQRQEEKRNIVSARYLAPIRSIPLFPGRKRFSLLPHPFPLLFQERAKTLPRGTKLHNRSGPVEDFYEATLPMTDKLVVSFDTSALRSPKRAL